MVRWSMLVGWYELLRNPCSIRFNKRYSGQKFLAARKRISGRLSRNSAKVGGKSVENEKKGYFADPEVLEKPTFVLPDPDASLRGMSVPEAGDVSTRHETTNLFEDSEEELDEQAGRRGKRRGEADDDSDDLV